MGPASNDLGAIDVAALMLQVRLQVPLGTVTVQGKVADVRRWSKDPAVAFGDLRGFDNSVMSFKCPYSDGLNNEDHVVLRGTLTAYKSRWYRGFDLLLEGTRIGAWQPSEPLQTVRFELTRLQSKNSLELFIVEDASRKLALIGTDTGIKDVLATLSKNVGQMPDPIVTTTSFEGLQAIIVEAAKTYDGLCLVRGGGDPNTFAAWNDSRVVDTLLRCEKRFYTALGHSTDLSLVDKYADEVFVAPSDLGAAITNAWRVRGEQQEKDNRLRYLSAENRKLKTFRDGENRTELDRKMVQLQSSLDEFQKLPAVLGKQTSQAVSSAIRASIQDDFKRPVADAIQVPLAKLTPVAKQASGVLPQALRQVRFHAWTWLIWVFLLGVVAGAFGLYSFERSMISGTQHELMDAKQQMPHSTQLRKERQGQVIEVTKRSEAALMRRSEMVVAR